MLVVCVDLNVCAAFDQYLDRIGVIAGASVYPFVWNILLAARNEGFGGVLTTMAVAEEPRVKELLGIPDDYAIAAVLPIGKPVKQVTQADPQAGLRDRHPRAIRRRASRCGSAGRWTFDNSSAVSQTRWRRASSPMVGVVGPWIHDLHVGLRRSEHRRAEPRGQLAALNAEGVDPRRVFTDKLSDSADRVRAGLYAMLSYARSGDTVIVVALDRLGRSPPR